MNELVNEYPFLKDLIDIYEKKKTLVYLGDDEYHHILIEFALDELLDRANSELDKTLSKDLSLKERYVKHDLLERALWKYDYMYIIEQFGLWFGNEYDYWDEADTHEDLAHPLIKTGQLL